MGLISFAKNAGNAILRRVEDNRKAEQPQAEAAPAEPTPVEIPAAASTAESSGTMDATAPPAPAVQERDSSNFGTVTGAGAERVYVTKDGDTFEAIATYFYGAEVHKQRILDENPSAMIYNNLRIPGGVSLRVSEDVAAAPMTEDTGATFATPQDEAHAAQTLTEMVNGLGLAVENLSITVSGETATITGTAATQADKEKVVLVAGNTQGIAQVDDQLQVREAAPEAVFYTVQSGDTLSGIAQAQYGDAAKYPVIFEANQPMLENPDLIYPGQVLRIPAQ